MNRVYNIDGDLIKAGLRPHAVHLVANYALRRAAKRNVINMDRLCRLILEDYRNIYGKELKIDINSLIVEILGHMYAYKTLLFFRKICSLGLFRKLSLRACTIDCAEKQYDSNRWFWDLCGYCKPVIFWIIR